MRLAFLDGLWAGVLRLKGPIVAIAGVGAVLSGLVGYYTTYKTVATATAPQVNAAATGARALPTIETDPSIAVLPLVNMSSDREQDYFSDGLSEELLNLLAKVPKLRVIARTSSFSFKGKDTPIEAIARKLHVAAVLEGSVRKSGDTLRIKVQLIRATDSSQLWSATFDRGVGDVFKVQDEIAAAVVSQLKVSLLAPIALAQPVDARAYELILQGRAVAREGTPAARTRAIELFREALVLAPRDNRARHGLGSMYTTKANLGELPAVQGYELARAVAQQGILVDPRDAISYAALGQVIVQSQGDLAAAAALMAKALTLEPANPSVLFRAASLVRALGKVEETIAIWRYLATLDPANPALYGNLSSAYLVAGRWDEAIASGRTTLSLSPSANVLHSTIARALLGKGDAVAALAEVEAEPNPTWRLLGLVRVYDGLGRKAEANAALTKLMAEDAHDYAYNIAEIHASRGETDAAFRWLRKAVAQRDSGLVDIANSGLFKPLHPDLRWMPLLRAIGKSPELLAAIHLKVDLPK